jgi:hypothetical protein
MKEQIFLRIVIVVRGAIIHCNWVMISITAKEIQRTGFFSKFGRKVKTFALYIVTFPP